jgi:hypothetical protein
MPVVQVQFTAFSAISALLNAVLKASRTEFCVSHPLGTTAQPRRCSSPMIATLVFSAPTSIPALIMSFLFPQKQRE